MGFTALKARLQLARTLCALCFFLSLQALPERIQTETTYGSLRFITQQARKKTRKGSFSIANTHIYWIENRRWFPVFLVVDFTKIKLLFYSYLKPLGREITGETFDRLKDAAQLKDHPLSDSDLSAYEIACARQS